MLFSAKLLGGFLGGSIYRYPESFLQLLKSRLP